MVHINHEGNRLRNKFCIAVIGPGKNTKTGITKFTSSEKDNIYILKNILETFLKK